MLQSEWQFRDHTKTPFLLLSHTPDFELRLIFLLEERSDPDFLDRETYIPLVKRVCDAELVRLTDAIRTDFDLGRGETRWDNARRDRLKQDNIPGAELAPVFPIWGITPGATRWMMLLARW
jgi:hypothetical protein